MKTSLKTLGLSGILAISSVGCGVSSWVTAPESKYPISLSSGVRDQSGQLVPSQRKTVVGEYTKSYKACSMLWRIISFTGDKDISADVNEKVSQAQGDAVTDLSVTSSGTVWNLFTLIGIFPDCANVEISGKIVKVAALPSAPLAKSQPAPVAPVAPPAPAIEAAVPSAAPAAVPPP
jgi:hypothetical protein